MSRAPAVRGAPLAACDVAVIGAGPYGLSTAAHLLAAGLTVEVFGQPMELWRRHMPAGMRLRSHWWATNLSEPSGMLGFGQYLNASRLRADYPLPSQAFIDYGLWFQSQAVPRVHETYVSALSRQGDRFHVRTRDGRQFVAGSVVMATGLRAYAQRPPVVPETAERFVSHSADHARLDRFAGATVIVVGAGQSALESAALLVEAGAAVHVVARRRIHWLAPDRVDERGFFERVAAPRNALAPGWRNLALERLPYLFYRAAQDRKDRWNDSYYLSAGSDWLRPRVVGKAALHEEATITRAVDAGASLDVALSDGARIDAAHLLMATGYRAGLSRLPMLAAPLRADIAADEDVPVLSASFESRSVPGLYFVGFTAIRAFGPLYRFVAGATPTACRVARAIVRRHRSDGRRPSAGFARSGGDARREPAWQLKTGAARTIE